MVMPWQRHQSPGHGRAVEHRIDQRSALPAAARSGSASSTGASVTSMSFADYAL